MDRMTIRKKLFLVFGVLIAIFVTNGLYTGYSLNQINSGALRIATEHLSSVMIGAESSRTLSDYRQGEYAVLMATTLPNRIHAAQETKKKADQLDIALDAMDSSVAPEVRDDFDALRSNWSAYKDTSQRAIRLAKDGKQAEAAALIDRSGSQYASMANQLNRVVDSSKDFIHQESAEASKKYEQTKWTLIVCILLVAGLSGVMAFYLSAGIMKSVRYLMQVSREITNKNLTIKAVPKTQDEFGELTATYGDTIRNLRMLIEHIQKTASEVSTFAAQLTENASQSAQATQQVAASVTNVAGNTSQQGEAVSRSLADIQEMSGSIQQFQEKATASVDSARRVEHIAGQGKESIDGAAAQMAEMLAPFFPQVADRVRFLARVRQQAERAASLGFLRRLAEEDAYEVLPLLRSFVTGAWLEEFSERLAQYRAYGAAQQEIAAEPSEEVALPLAPADEAPDETALPRTPAEERPEETAQPHVPEHTPEETTLPLMTAGKTRPRGLRVEEKEEDDDGLV